MSDFNGMKNVPEHIWLQVGDDDPESFKGDDFNDMADDGQVAWCADHQYEPDVPYVRADKVAELEQQVASLEDANALLLKDEKASPAIIAGYRFRGEQLIEENESLRDRLAKVNENKYVWYQKGYDYGMRVGNDQQLNGSECDLVALADELSGAKKRIECYEEENAKLKERIASLEEQLDKLKRMEFICSRCGIRKDGESEGGDF